MTTITYGKSVKIIDNAKTRRHARRRAAALERESIENAIDRALGINAAEAPVVEQHMGRIEKAILCPSLRNRRPEPQRVNACNSSRQGASVYGRLSGNGRQKRHGKSIPLI